MEDFQPTFALESNLFYIKKNIPDSVLWDTHYHEKRNWARVWLDESKVENTPEIDKC